MRHERALDLEKILPEMVAGVAAAVSYRCTEARAELIPVEKIQGPVRRLNRAAALSLIDGIRKGADIEPVDVCGLVLINGLHRWRVSIACGFTHLPCLQVDEATAEMYGLKRQG